MLMQGVNGNALRDSSGGLCKYTAECIVTLVANAAPVHGAKDDRLPCTHKNDAFAPQAQVPHANSRITYQVAANRWCGVNIKSCQTQAF